MHISKLNVGGVNYSVTLEENLIDPSNKQHAWGYTDYAKGVIYIDKSLNEQHIMQTLVHELLHAMLWETGATESYNDENIINPLGNMLYSVLHANDLNI